MKMDQMTIAQVQHHMSKVLANQNLRPWSVDDEIDTARWHPIEATPSRNQREGYFDGKRKGGYYFFTRVKHKINRKRIS